MDVLVASFFALVAGAGTAVSPCVLPVLPLALAGAATGGRRRPLGIAAGLAASFAFATLVLAYVIDALGLPDDLLRTLAIVVLAGFGVALMVPSAAARLEAWLGRLVPAVAPRRWRGGDGFGSGVVLGASLGLLYVPCAGPVLAAVLTVQASQSLSAHRIAIGLAYAAGTAGGVLLVLLAGRRALAGLRARAGRLQQALGAVMVVVAVLTLTGADTRFQSAVADHLPGWLVSPTSEIESSRAATRALQGASGPATPLARAGAGRELPDGGPAPELTGIQRWFNTPDGRPLTLAGLRGRVVLLDFWTYTCINCLRTLPYVKAWDAAYRRDGLTVIGVHSPEFPFERSAANVARAVRTDGLRYPVAQDNRFTVWKAFQNQFWPAKYLIDARGHLRYVHFGEGDYARTERAIRTLLREADGDRATRRQAVSDAVRAQHAAAGVSTRETYLGAERARGWLQDPLVAGGRDFGPLPARVPRDRFAYGGVWRIGSVSATAIHAAAVRVRFGARRVFLVLGGRGTVAVRLDGRPTRTVTVRRQRLYPLVALPRPGVHDLELRFSHGVRGYAFTFG
jgi:cytochrome c biogenesis protein CcdA/thiol-disulfide isomerase/thioredoxin